MRRILAMIEREMRRYFKSPALLALSLIVPMFQMLVIGNAFSNRVRDTRLAVVDYDHGPQSVRLREAFSAIAVNVATFRAVDYQDEASARSDIRSGKIDAIAVIPAQYSRRYYAKDAPSIGLILDNSDEITAAGIQGEMALVLNAINAPIIQPRLARDVALKVVEIYPLMSYFRFILPGSVMLGIYYCVMIGGGSLAIEDKSRGVHEGYLVTPITRLQLVLGFTGGGTIKAALSGIASALIGGLMAGIGKFYHPATLLNLLLVIVVSAVAFNGMMFLIMVRVTNPAVPRAVFGTLNTLLCWGCGAFFPISTMNPFFRYLALINPFTYSADAFKSLMLKGSGFAAIRGDLLFLSIFGLLTIAVATPLYKRSM
jgi:ABC-2 type transport system permease protein